MSVLMQFALPFLVSLLVLAIFHGVAYAHVRLAESESLDDSEFDPADF